MLCSFMFWYFGPLGSFSPDPRSRMLLQYLYYLLFIFIFIFKAIENITLNFLFLFFPFFSCNGVKEKDSVRLKMVMRNSRGAHFLRTFFLEFYWELLNGCCKLAMERSQWFKVLMMSRVSGATCVPWPWAFLSYFEWGWQREEYVKWWWWGWKTKNTLVCFL